MHKEINLPTFNAGALQPSGALNRRSRVSQDGLSEIGLLVGLMIFAPLIEGGTTHLPVLIIRLLLVAGLALWIFRSFRSGTMTICRHSVLPLVAMFVGVSGLGVLHSSYVGVSIQGVVGLFMYGVFLFLLLHQLCPRSLLRALVLVIVSMGLLEGLLGIIQYVWIGDARARGTFFNPNFFAIYEAVTVVLTLSLLSWMTWGEHKWRERCLLGAAFGISLPAFIMAQSRGALIAFVVALLFLGLCRSWKLALLLPLVVILAVIALPNPIKQRALAVSDQDPYAYTRFEIWKSSLDRIVDHPVGTGVGTYKYLSFTYRFPVEGAIVRYGKRAESAHNEYLQMAVELGVGGLALFLVGIGVWGWDVKRVLQSGLSSWERGAAVGLSGGAVALLGHATMDSVFHEPALVLLLILCGGLVLSMKQLANPASVPIVRFSFSCHRTRGIMAVVFLVLLVALIVRSPAAWFVFEQGNSAAEKGEHESAREWYQRATDIDPGISAYWDAVASTEVDLFRVSDDPGWLVKAVGNIKMCMELSPLDARFPSRLGAIYLMLADRAGLGEQAENLVREASGGFEQAIELDAFSPFNYAELGKVRWRQGRREEARVLFSQALTYEPNFLPARVLLANLAIKSGWMDLAKTQYAIIRETRNRYDGLALNSLERQYVNVDADLLEKQLHTRGFD
ncbi:MAG: O-antigen ligase family protein [Nitrospira sp.]